MYPGPRGFLALGGAEGVNERWGEGANLAARSRLWRPRERENLWDQGTLHAILFVFFKSPARAW